MSPASLTFTAANWNTAQTVTVTGVDDSLDDGDIAYSDRDGGGDEQRTATTTGSNAADVSRHQHRQRRVGDHGDADQRADDDGGRRDGDVHGGADAQPTADVTVGLSSSDTTEGTVGAGVADVHGGELEHGADGDGDRRRRRPGRRRHRLHHRDGGGDERATATTTGSNPADVAVTNTDNDASGHHGDADQRADDDGGRRHGDVHGRAERAADGGRDGRASARATRPRARSAGRR